MICTGLCGRKTTARSNVDGYNERCEIGAGSDGAILNLGTGSRQQIPHLLDGGHSGSDGIEVPMPRRTGGHRGDDFRCH